MANKREFKKYVEALGASVCEEIMLAYYNIKDADKTKLEEALRLMVTATEDARSKSNLYFNRGMKSFDSHAEYAKAKKEFFFSLFNKIDNDFSAAVDESLKLFNSAIPQSVKEKNKKISAE